MNRPSTAIEAVAYDEERRVLIIRFVGGATYTYLDVPLFEYAALMEAESLGGYVNRRIKPNYEVREGGEI